MPTASLRARHAFTLVELSIVLVILGLLVGGVLSGQSLIHSAELRAVIRERDNYQTAINAFRDKYFALPGDMPNGFAYWGSACGFNTTAPLNGCNGNGNGQIEALGSAENIKAWEHLARAGLIEGSFDGTGTLKTGNYVEFSTTNVPASKYGKNYWDLTSNSGDMCDPGGVPLTTGLYLVMGGLTSAYDSGGYMQTSQSLTPADSVTLDRKVDDGRSYTGTVRGSTIGDCQDAGDDAYGLALIGPETKGQCTAYFILR